MKIHPLAVNRYFLSSNAENPPLSQHSIRISPESKSLSCAHNSVTPPVLRKINPSHFRLHIYFGSIPILYYSQKLLDVTRPTQVFWPEFWLSTKTTMYVSQVSHVSASLALHPNIYPVHILLCSSLCSFIEFPIISSNILPNIFFSNPNICDTQPVKDQVLFNSPTKTTLETFSQTQQYAGWIVICGHFCKIWAKFLVV